MRLTQAALLLACASALKVASETGVLQSAEPRRLRSHKESPLFEFFAGIFLFIFCIGLQFYNERRAVRMDVLLDRVEKDLRESGADAVLDDDSSSAHEMQRIIFLKAKLHRGERIPTTNFGGHTFDELPADAVAAKLHHSWVEIEHTSDGKKTKTKHEHKYVYSAGSKVGKFILSEAIADELLKLRAKESHEEVKNKGDEKWAIEYIKDDLKCSVIGVQCDAEITPVFFADRYGHSSYGLLNVDTQDDVEKDEVKLESCGPCALAKQQCEKLAKLLVVAEGHDSDWPELMKKARKNHDLMTKLGRWGGCCGQCIGLQLFFSPLHYVFSFVWIIGGVLSFALSVISLTIATLVSMVNISVAWFYFRPLLSIVLIAVTGAIVGGIVYFQDEIVDVLGLNQSAGSSDTVMA